MFTVKCFYQKYGKDLELSLIAGEKGLSNPIPKAEVHRPGLSLSGYLKNMGPKRILLFGKVEISYLKELSSSTCKERLEPVINEQTPLVIVARKLNPPKEMKEICDRKNIPLLRTNLTATDSLSKTTFNLNEEFSPEVSLHGTLVELYGMGVFLQGDSSIGKSEAALGLVERGHRLISDDLVRIKKKEGRILEGFGHELAKHVMEIRGIGIINIAHLYGAVSVRPSKVIELVIKMEEWDDSHFYDRIGLEEKGVDILGITLPFYLLPIKPGRDIVLLIETVVLNHRLKGMGYHSAKEFNAKFLQTLASKNRKRTIHETLQKD